METSSVDIDKLLSKNFFLWIQCPKISLLLFKDGADLRMESFSCKQSPHTLLLGANGFTLLTTCEANIYIDVNVPMTIMYHVKTFRAGSCWKK